MARRNVDLIIRAKDEAQKTLKSIGASLEAFLQTQRDVAKQAGATDSTLSRLGASFRSLGQALGGAADQARFAELLQRAGGELTRLKGVLQATQQEADKYAAELKVATERTEALRLESEQTAASIKQQKAAVEQARAAQRALATATEAATRERSRLVAKDVQITQQIDKQVTKLERLQAAYRQTAAEIAKTDAPTEKLQNRLTRLGGQIERASGELTELSTTQSVVRAAIDGTVRAVERANAAYGGQAADLDRLVAGLGRLTAQARQIDDAFNEAVSGQAKLQSAAKRTAASLQQQGAAIEQAEADYRELKAAAAGAEASMSKLEKVARGTMLRAFSDQRTVVRSLRTEYEASKQKAAELGAEVKRLGRFASADLVQSFNAAQAATRRIKEEFLAQRDALTRMSKVLAETGGDFDAFAARVRRFESITAGAAGSMRVFATSAHQVAAAQRQAASAGTQAAGQIDRTARATRDYGNAAKKASVDTNTLAGAIRTFYGEGRTALSWMQRLRSEVLALITAYGGFFAVIQGTRRVVDAFQTLESAQTRLRAVFEGNTAAVDQEINFLQRNANRLGIEFGVLADEYTKFAIAAKGTNLEGAETRRIFIKVAEAARVQRLSVENVKGVFVALSQIVSKGSVQMEELRQQLGDRLPGALQIMAAGLGVSTAKLIKMMEQGEVSADALSGFATELDRRFGKQLPDALNTTSAALGRLQNALFNAFLRIAEGGFIDSFTEVVNELSEVLNSARFESFADRVSVALGGVVKALGLLAKNFDGLVMLAAALISLKLVPFFVFLRKEITLLSTRIGVAILDLQAFRNSTVAATAGMTLMARAAATARLAIAGLLSSTGIGIAVVAIGTAIGAWVTSTEDATEALNEHARVLAQVKDAYDQTTGKVEEWRKAVKGVSIAQERIRLRDLTEAYREAVKDFENTIQSARNVPSVFKGITDIFAQYRRTGDVEALRKQIDKFFEGLRKGASPEALIWIEDFGKKFADAAEEIEAIQTPMTETAQIIDAMDESSDTAQDSLDELTGNVKTVGRTAKTESERIADFNAALATMEEVAGKTRKELERLKEAAELESAFAKAINLARSADEAIRAMEAYRAKRKEFALDALEDVAGGGREQAAALLRRFENPAGPWLTPQFDTNKLRIGYSSDTIRGGQKVVEGMRITVAEAEEELVRRIDLAFEDIRKQIGEERFESFHPQQQAVLASIVYNYGSIPARILEAVREGSVKEIEDAIFSLRGDNTGRNAKRREEEAARFGAAGKPSDEPYFKALDDRREAERKLAEERRKEAEREAERRAKEIADAKAASEERRTDLAQQIRQQQLINEGKGLQAAVEQAIFEARKENPDIAPEVLDDIIRKTVQLYHLENSAADAAQERVAKLIELRSVLQEQLQTALDRGDFGAIGRLDEQLRNVNKQLVEAIDNALELLKPLAAMDPAIAAAVSRLETLRVTAVETSGEIVISFEQVANTFASGLTNAIDKFIAGMHEGKSATESARDAFLQFAADFLREIAKMIIQQIILNAVKQMMMSAGVAHEGGIVGQSGAKRRVAIAHEGGVAGQRGGYRALDPAHFARAMRMHSGGVAVLRPNEVPMVLERGEEVLTRDDPRHLFNMRKSDGGDSSSGQNVRVVNAFDGTDFLEQALKTRDGERIVLNFLKARGGAVRSAIGG